MEVPLLSYIDDLNKIAKCGLNALESNIFITKQIEMKRLQFNVGSTNKKSKCQIMHIGSKSSKCLPVFARNKALDEVNQISYLGDLVDCSGDNMPNIRNRVAKSKAIISDIFSILENICLGPHFFRIALLPQKTMLISSICFNLEIWYNLREN